MAEIISEDVLAKVLSYYTSGFRRNLRGKIQAIGKKLVNGVPSIVSVFGLGYPFYGDYDVTERIRETIKSKGLTSPDMISILPDIDLLVVYDSDEHPNKISPTFEKEVMEDFSRTIGRDAHYWKRVYSKLVNECGVADRDKDPVSEFSKGKLHIDLVPVPKSLWMDLPYLFHPDDLKHLKKVSRDILFTAEHIHTKKPYQSEGLHKVRDQFLMNKLLYHIWESSNKGELKTEKELINQILRSHPYSKSLIFKFPQIYENQYNKWRRVLNQLKKQGLVESRDNRLCLTENGFSEMNKLMRIREQKRRRWGLI